jgi:hypothetical protein
MHTSITKASFIAVKNEVSINLLNIKHLLLAFFFFILFLPLKSFSQAIDFQQAQNGDPTAFPITFTNGILNATQTTYYEGMGIPQRMIFTGLTPTGANKYTVYFNFLAGTPNKGVHAFDMLMSWEQAVQTAIKYGGTIVGTGTENELANLFSTGCQNAPVECTALTGGTSFSKRVEVPDIPVATTGFYSGVDENITCFEGLFGNRDIEIRGNAAISSAVLTFIGYDGDYARFKLDWVSLSTNIMIRYASRASLGDGPCGYGAGHGAGAISGGNYHNIFEQLVKNDGNKSEIKGSRDNQLMSGAITVVPPPNCPTIPFKSVCPTATTIGYSVTQETGVTYKWALTNGATSANAKLQNADANGFVAGTSANVIPIDANGFTAGGTFSLTLTLSKTGTPDVTCNFADVGLITKLITTASASPNPIDITSSAHSTTLTADIDATSSDPNNANYDYQWVIVTAGVTGSLTNATSRIATFTADILDAGSTIEFKVTATHKDDANANTQECADDATTSVSVTSIGACDVSPSNAVCQGSTVTHNGSPSPKSTNVTYVWTLEANGGGGSTTATFVDAAAAAGGSAVSVQVVANQSYRVKLTQTYANTALNTSCFEDVTVVATPSVSATYNPPACFEKQFTVDVTSPTVGYTYSIDQPDNNLTFNSITPTAQSPAVHFTGLTNGDGFIVTVNTGGPGCTSTYSCVNPNAARLATNTENTEANKTTKPSDTYNIKLVSPTKVNAVPNPFTDKIRFNLVSTISGMGSLELYNMLGQKVGVVYQGYVQAGQELTKEYLVAKEKRGSLIYVFKVGDQRVTGKLIGLK